MEIKKVVQLFSLTYLINVIGGSFINNVYILFLSTTKQFSDQQISLIMGIIPLVAIPAVFIWGKILDKSKALTRWGTFNIVINGVSLLLLYFTNNFELFFGIALIRTLLTQPLGSICEEYMINITKKANMPYGKVRRIGTLGGAIAGMIAPIILLFANQSLVMLTGIIITLISALLFYQLPIVRLEDEEIINEKIGEKVGVIHLFKNKQYLVIFFIIAFTYGSMNSAAGYGSQTLLIKMNCPETLIVAFPFILAIFEILILGISHKFRVEQKPYRAFFIGAIVLCIRWIILSLSSHYVTVIISTLLQGFIVGLTLPAQNYIIAQVVPEKERSTAYLLSVVMQVSIVPGILNLFIGNTLNTLGLSVFGVSYLAITCIALLLIVPMLIKETKKLKRV